VALPTNAERRAGDKLKEALAEQGLEASRAAGSEQTISS
jgi:hypothetical protein